MIATNNFRFGHNEEVNNFVPLKIRMKHENSDDKKQKIKYEEKFETIKLKDLEQIEPVFKIENENKFKEETRKTDLNEIMKMTNLLLQEDEVVETIKNEEINKLCEEMKDLFKRITDFGRTQVSSEIKKNMDVKIVCEENGKGEPYHLIFDNNIAGTVNEHRHLLKVEIVGKNYVALFDPGSQVTTVRPAIANLENEILLTTFI